MKFASLICCPDGRVLFWMLLWFACILHSFSFSFYFLISVFRLIPPIFIRVSRSRRYIIYYNLRCPTHHYLFIYWLINNKDNNEHFSKTKPKMDWIFSLKSFHTLPPPLLLRQHECRKRYRYSWRRSKKALICTTRREWTAAAAVAPFPFHFTSTAPNTAHLFTPSIKDDDDPHPQQHSSSAVAVCYRKSIAFGLARATDSDDMLRASSVWVEPFRIRDYLIRPCRVGWCCAAAAAALLTCIYLSSLCSSCYTRGI